MMKHIPTTATVIQKIKSHAKKLKKENNTSLAQALETAAKHIGYESFHHATHCFNKSNEGNSNLLGTLCFEYWQIDNVVRFAVKDRNKLDKVTDELDDFVANCDGGGFGDMTLIGEQNLISITELCRKLTNQEPAFLDGYAHWIGALSCLDQDEKAVEIGLPICNELVKMVSELNDYTLSYSELANRPFYRFIHNFVIASYKIDENDLAQELSLLMLNLWPTDNSGFRELLANPFY